MESVFPYSYFAARVALFLPLTFTALIAWFAFGFDIPEGWVPVIGIQWSTFATFFFFWYLLMVNFQVGGLQSFRQLGHEMKTDLEYTAKFFRKGKVVREYYPKEGALDGFTALIVSLCIVTSCMFIFESAWVPLYDYFQFHSLMWPVYFADTHRFLNSAVYTNSIMAVVPLLLAAVLIKLAVDGSPSDPSPVFRYKVKMRLGFGSVFLALVALSLWAVWIAFPHTPQSSVTAILQSSHETAYNPLDCFVYPTQGLFPQNTYTFYPCASVGKEYSLNSFYGFFVPNDALHAVNVLTKFVTFAAVCYPAMGFVKRTK